jgi:hypothetical protein
MKRFACALAIGVVGAGVMGASDAAGYVYWTNEGAGTIGRAGLDGTTGLNQSFIPNAGTSPCGIAVDSAHIYWAHAVNPGTIGRANLDGSNVDPNFITGAGNGPCGVAVDSNYIYFDQDNNVGRANLNGTSPDHNFITGGDAVCGEAVNSSFLYWTNSNNNNTHPIGRSDLDGNNINQMFIANAAYPCGIAVDGSFVYWANDLHNDPGTIGRVALDGTTGLTQTFITGAHGPFGVAVDSAHVYWGNNASNAIGRAGLDGTTGITQTFITGANAPSGVAVDSLGPGGGGSPPPSNSYTIVPRVTCAGVCHVILVKITFDSAGNVTAEQALPGQLDAETSKKKTKPLIKRLTQVVSAGANTLKLKLTGPAQKTLREKGKLRIQVRFSFTPIGGTASSRVQAFTVKLPKKN